MKRLPGVVAVAAVAGMLLCAALSGRRPAPPSSHQAGDVRGGRVFDGRELPRGGSHRGGLACPDVPVYVMRVLKVPPYRGLCWQTADGSEFPDVELPFPDVHPISPPSRESSGPRFLWSRPPTPPLVRVLLLIGNEVVRPRSSPALTALYLRLSIHFDVALLVHDRREGKAVVREMKRQEEAGRRLLPCLRVWPWLLP